MNVIEARYCRGCNVKRRVEVNPITGDWRCRCGLRWGRARDDREPPPIMAWDKTASLATADEVLAEIEAKVKAHPEAAGALRQIASTLRMMRDRTARATGAAPLFDDRHEERSQVLVFAREAGTPRDALEKIHAGDIRKSDALAAVHEAFEARGIGVVLLGGIDTGKTFALAYLLYQSAIQAAANANRGSAGCYVDAREWSACPLYGSEAHAHHQRLSACAVLALDELGRESSDPTGRWMTSLETVLDARMRSRRPTYVASPLAMRDFVGRYGASVIKRLGGEQSYIELGQRWNVEPSGRAASGG